MWEEWTKVYSYQSLFSQAVQVLIQCHSNIFTNPLQRFTLRGAHSLLRWSSYSYTAQNLTHIDSSCWNGRALRKLKNIQDKKFLQPQTEVQLQMLRELWFGSELVTIPILPVPCTRWLPNHRYHNLPFPISPSLQGLVLFCLSMAGK